MEKDKNKYSFLVKTKDLGMDFKLHEQRYTSLKERVISLLKFKKNKVKTLNVLSGVNFEIKQGESLGVIGHNGAGKSTLLKIVAGIYKPTRGKINRNGSVVLLNLGAGFDMEATAEENIFLNGALLGFSHKQMKQRFNSIVEFAELQDFIKMPLKNFSSGMVSRLGFAIAIDIKPDLLLIDEVLSVGDTNFKKKCLEKINELKDQGVSFMFVSHGIDQVKKLCEKTLWIENSKVMAYGESGEVCAQYTSYCNNLAKVNK